MDPRVNKPAPVHHSNKLQQQHRQQMPVKLMKSASSFSPAPNASAFAAVPHFASSPPAPKAGASGSPLTPGLPPWSGRLVSSSTNILSSSSPNGSTSSSNNSASWQGFVPPLHDAPTTPNASASTAGGPSGASTPGLVSENRPLAHFIHDGSPESDDSVAGGQGARGAREGGPSGGRSLTGLFEDVPLFRKSQPQPPVSSKGHSADRSREFDSLDEIGNEGEGRHHPGEGATPTFHPGLDLSPKLSHRSSAPRHWRHATPGAPPQREGHPPPVAKLGLATPSSVPLASAVSQGSARGSGGRRLFVCRFCRRHFTCGRALGGHMKTHRGEDMGVMVGISAPASQHPKGEKPGGMSASMPAPSPPRAMTAASTVLKLPRSGGVAAAGPGRRMPLDLKGVVHSRESLSAKLEQDELEEQEQSVEDKLDWEGDEEEGGDAEDDGAMDEGNEEDLKAAEQGLAVAGGVASYLEAGEGQQQVQYGAVEFARGVPEAFSPPPLQCQECLRVFESSRALSQHRRFHRTAVWKGAAILQDSSAAEEVQEEDRQRQHRDGDVEGGGPLGRSNGGVERAGEEDCDDTEDHEEEQEEEASEAEEEDDMAWRRGTRSFKPRKPSFQGGGMQVVQDARGAPAAEKGGAHAKAAQQRGGGFCCSECGKVFGSWKALFGHMRCHPEREWRGIHRPTASASAQGTGSGSSPRPAARPAQGSPAARPPPAAFLHEGEEESSDGEGSSAHRVSPRLAPSRLLDLPSYATGRRSMGKPKRARDAQPALAHSEAEEDLGYEQDGCGEAAFATKRLRSSLAGEDGPKGGRAASGLPHADYSPLGRRRLPVLEEMSEGASHLRRGRRAEGGDSMEDQVVWDTASCLVMLSASASAAQHMESEGGGARDEGADTQEWGERVFPDSSEEHRRSGAVAWVALDGKSEAGDDGDPDYNSDDSSYFVEGPRATAKARSRAFLPYDTEQGEGEHWQALEGSEDEEGDSPDGGILQGPDEVADEEENVRGSGFALHASNSFTARGRGGFPGATQPSLVEALGHPTSAKAGSSPRGARGSAQQPLTRESNASISSSNSSLLGAASQATRGKGVQTGSGAGAGAGASRGKYVCDKCGRAFSSYQALGGHRSSHRRGKPSPSSTADKSEPLGSAAPDLSLPSPFAMARPPQGQGQSSRAAPRRQPSHSNFKLSRTPSLQSPTVHKSQAEEQPWMAHAPEVNKSQKNHKRGSAFLLEETADEDPQNAPAGAQGAAAYLEDAATKDSSTDIFGALERVPAGRRTRRKGPRYSDAGKDGTPGKSQLAVDQDLKKQPARAEGAEPMVPARFVREGLMPDRRDDHPQGVLDLNLPSSAGPEKGGGGSSCPERREDEAHALLECTDGMLSPPSSPVPSPRPTSLNHDGGSQPQIPADAADLPTAQNSFVEAQRLFWTIPAQKGVDSSSANDPFSLAPSMGWLSHSHVQALQFLSSTGHAGAGCARHLGNMTCACSACTHHSSPAAAFAGAWAGLGKVEAVGPGAPGMPAWLQPLQQQSGGWEQALVMAPSVNADVREEGRLASASRELALAWGSQEGEDVALPSESRRPSLPSGSAFYGHGQPAARGAWAFCSGRGMVSELTAPAAAQLPRVDTPAPEVGGDGRAADAPNAGASG